MEKKLWKGFKEFNLWMWNNPSPLGKIDLILTYAIPIGGIVAYLIVR